jgi:RNase P subunit RPR2
MTDPNGAIIPVTCQCGKKFNVPIGGLDLETLVFTCPNCGTRDQFTKEQIANIVAQYDTIVAEGRQIAVDELNKISKRFNRSNKRR